MSAFLGPIHTWLYSKILFQNELVEKIISFANENNWMNDSIRLNRYGNLEEGALEDIVDPNNIHGWLQERVSLVENKLAYIVTALLEDHPKRLDELKTLSYNLGASHGMTEFSNAEDAYEYIDSLLLNGMPCDRVNRVIDITNDSLKWEQTQDIHGKYWEMVHGDVKNFYEIRKSIISGILSKSGFDFVEKDGFYEIKR
ncbi:hypothetical protein P261_01406 [Lachnospiraceae bacterium TWA4]|nr:hypothetical protein P261_01406 [Lachnospiraceae bacterium TWA4]